MPRDGDRDRDRDRAAPLRSVVASPDLASTVAEVGQRWPYAPRRERCRGRGAAGGCPAPLGSALLGGAGSGRPRTAIYRRRGGHAHRPKPRPSPRAPPPACGAEAKPPEGGKREKGGAAACGGCELPRREPSCCPLTPQSASRAP